MLLELIHKYNFRLANDRHFRVYVLCVDRIRSFRSVQFIRSPATSLHLPFICGIPSMCVVYFTENYFVSGRSLWCAVSSLPRTQIPYSFRLECCMCVFLGRRESGHRIRATVNCLHIMLKWWMAISAHTVYAHPHTHMRARRPLFRCVGWCA